MNSDKVDMYIIANAKYFDTDHLPIIRERLLAVDESKWYMISTIELKDPTNSLIISIIAGSLGIDRFVIGDVGLGIGKLLTCGGLGVWAIVDWFLIQGATKQKNLNKIQQFLF